MKPGGGQFFRRKPLHTPFEERTDLEQVFVKALLRLVKSSIPYDTTIGDPDQLHGKSHRGRGAHRDPGPNTLSEAVNRSAYHRVCIQTFSHLDEETAI